MLFVLCLLALASLCVATPAQSREDQWSAGAIAALMEEAVKASYDGLNPADYGSLDKNMTAAQAEDYALRLASDLARGKVRDRSAHEWFIDAPAKPDNELAYELAQALDEQDLQSWFQSLRPDDPSYEVLRERLKVAKTPAEKVRLKANLERWRWMPRDLPQGERIIVNVPTYRLAYVQEDGAVDIHDVVVGTKRTPTPQLMADATDVVINPPWNVPPSIAKGLRAGKKYRAIPTGSGGYRLQQRPGPGNALGRFKIEMPNDHAIYLHDTPSKGLFSEEERAFSHGCIRVKGIARLAAKLASETQDSSEFAPILASLKTRWLPIGKTIPVMILYFTAEVQDDGTIQTYPDIYGRDEKLVKALG